MGFGQKLGLGLAEAHRLAAGPALHLTHQEDPDGENEQDRTEGEKHRPDRIGVVPRRRRGDPHILAFEARDQLRVVRRIGLEGLPTIPIIAGDPLTLDRHRSDPARVHIGQELGIGNLARIGILRAVREQLEDRDQEKGDDRPQREVSEILVHQSS